MRYIECKMPYPSKKVRSKDFAWASPGNHYQLDYTCSVIKNICCDTEVSIATSGFRKETGNR